MRSPTDAARLHLVLGWWMLTLFAGLGLALEALHGLKAGLYLDAGQDTRRLMWTLAHTHGALIGLINLAFVGAIERGGWRPGRLAWASRLLRAAAVMMPLGFFLGGLGHFGADPGLGVWLVPPGGVALVAALVITARAVGRSE